MTGKFEAFASPAMQDLQNLQQQMLQNMFGPISPEDPGLLLYRETARYSYQEALGDLFCATKTAYEFAYEAAAAEVQTYTVNKAAVPGAAAAVPSTVAEVDSASRGNSVIDASASRDNSVIDASASHGNSAIDAEVASATNGNPSPALYKKTWEELGEEFLSEFWPTEIRLNRNFEKFPEWLPAESWILEVAEYEWAQYIASTSRGVRDEDQINPSVVLLYFEFKIPRWIKNLEEEKSLSVPEIAPSTVAVFRDIHTERVRTVELQPAAFELLAEWINGGTPEISAKTLGQQLNKSTEEMMLQIDPLIKKLSQEGVLLQPSRKNTRYFIR